MGVHTDDNDKLTPAIIEALMRHERTRKIIEYLAEHKDELLTPQRLQIIFNCAGPKVKPSRTIYDEM